MGIRADFYIGRGEEAEWRVSLAFEGSPEKVEDILRSQSKTEFVNLARQKSWSRHSEWPWGWQTSHQTDYAYAWDDGQVWVSKFGRGWVPAEAYFFSDDVNWESFEKQVFPNMKEGFELNSPISWYSNP